MFISPQIFTEAVDKLGAREPTAASLRSQGWRSVPTDLRERAFFTSGVEDARFLQQAQDLLLDSLKGTRAVNEAGESYVKVDRTKFIQEMREFAIRHGMGPLDPGDENTLKDIRGVGRLGLIYDVNIQAANDFGYWKQGMDPDVLEAFPSQRFIRVRHVRVPRPYHVANEGAVKRKDDLDFWLSMNRDFGVPWGPWGYGSGMDVEDVGRSESEERGLVQKNEHMVPVDRKFNDLLAAGVKGLGPQLLDELARLFGRNVKIDGDQIKWIGAARDEEKASPGDDDAPAENKEGPAPGDAEDSDAAPVSDAFPSLSVTVDLRAQVRHALAVVDGVHTDGDLIPVAVMPTTKAGVLGTFRTLNGWPQQISLRSGGPWPAVTLVHELGHYLDFWTLGREGEYASDAHPALEGWRRAVAKSAAVKQIQASAYPQLSSYLLRPRELWARGYAQFVAAESADPILLAQIKKIRKASAWRQWEDGDFLQISDEIRAIFRSKGWM